MSRLGRTPIDPAAWLNRADGRKAIREGLAELDASGHGFDQEHHPPRYQTARRILLDLPDLLLRAEFDLEFALWSLAKLIDAPPSGGAPRRKK